LEIITPPHEPWLRGGEEARPMPDNHRAMSKSEEWFQERKDRIRKRFLRYTRRAFRSLPPLARPRILDIGCGNGIPTVELAKLSDGMITALDREQRLLDEVAERAAKAGVADRIKTVRMSMAGMRFRAASFDIIWAEGSIAAIGFHRGLREWKRFLKPGGFMGIHDEKGDVERKREQISRCGYALIRCFIVDEDVWRAEYLVPLERLVRDAERRLVREPTVARALREARNEIDGFTKNQGRLSSVFFVMKNSHPTEER
jgi:ubiquinone/menaquinone biosynthesis C-methylase UbiE